VAHNTFSVGVAPGAVWEVLADPRLYGTWVVGASSTRKVEGDWPEPGATFHHTQMLLVRDTTTVVEAEPGRRILLEARARPVVVAMVDVRLEPDGAGTRIVIDEWAVGGLAGLFPRAVSDAFIHVRNEVAIRRLARLAEMGVRLRLRG
jgi:carbon monoxide dehydrogenase subunit G